VVVAAGLVVILVTEAMEVLIPLVKEILQFLVRKAQVAAAAAVAAAVLVTEPVAEVE
jgi:hypothetical protein